MYMYGGASPNNEKAQKAALNELKGLMAFYRTHTQGLHYPLMSLIHYRGFTLIAASIVRAAFIVDIC